MKSMSELIDEVNRSGVHLSSDEWLAWYASAVVITYSKDSSAQKPEVTK